MAAIDERNRPFSWVVGILCAGVIGMLVYLAAPMLPMVVSYVGNALNAVAP